MAMLNVARRLFVDKQVDFWMGKLDGAWSLRELRARVVDIVDETHDTKTFVLLPNRNWPAHLHRAGQHTMIEVELDGARVRRCFTIASAPGERFLRLTIKRNPTGRVSSWLHDHARPGTIVGLSPPAGDFVLPDLHGKLLMIAGGSGITPLMSMLRDLSLRGAVGDVSFVAYARSPEDVIFGEELKSLALSHPGLRVVVRHGLFDENALYADVPDLAAREVYLCGPAPMMERVAALPEVEGRLHQERFGLAAPRNVTGTALVTLGARTVEVAAAQTLLVGLEAAGERPAHGCRMGICGTCKTRKKSGTVTNLLTGAVSSEPDEDIQLCISTAGSDLELAVQGE